MTMTTKARVSLNLPTSLRTVAEQCARRDGVSLNQFIATALAEKVGAQGAAFFTERARGGSAARAIGLLRAAPDTPPDDQDARLS